MTSAGEPISLYFQLKPGEKADLEVVAAAAIAWVQTLRATARAIDPDADIRVELVDADESSLILNAVLAWFENHVERRLERLDRGGQKLPRTKKLAMALTAFVFVTGIPTYDFYFGDEPFTEEDRRALNEILSQTAKDPSVEAAARKFYRTVERDPAIVGVGIKEDPAGEPLAVVPSQLFAEAGGLWVQPSDVSDVRVSTNTLEVVLVRPTLTHTPRAWTFKIDGLPEFDAVMRDPEVLSAIETGRYIDMREGIPMTIRLEAKEILVDGQWQLQRSGRSVVEVLTPRPR
jgi:hypothetical protein